MKALVLAAGAALALGVGVVPAQAQHQPGYQVQYEGRHDGSSRRDDGYRSGYGASVGVRDGYQGGDQTGASVGAGYGYRQDDAYGRYGYSQYDTVGSPNSPAEVEAHVRTGDAAGDPYAAPPTAPYWGGVGAYGRTYPTYSSSYSRYERRDGYYESERYERRDYRDDDGYYGAYRRFDDRFGARYTYPGTAVRARVGYRDRYGYNDDRPPHYRPRTYQSRYSSSPCTCAYTVLDDR